METVVVERSVIVVVGVGSVAVVAVTPMQEQALE